ncbi:MAG TPA: hypothetical protein EYP90_10475, partial [Chromatiaceae bacterium]|nr:hypothetical protein [Chromatiaceae bacterium]
MPFHRWRSERMEESRGIELTVRQRTAGFGSQDEWLARCEADVILGFFGSMESFRGPDHLPTFRADLAGFIEHVATL